MTDNEETPWAGLDEDGEEPIWVQFGYAEDEPPEWATEQFDLDEDDM